MMPRRCLLLIALAAGPAVAEDTAPRELPGTVDEPVSLVAVGLSLQELTKALHRLTGVQFEVDPKAGRSVPQSLVARDEPLSRVLESMARKYRARWEFRDGVCHVAHDPHAPRFSWAWREMSVASVASVFLTDSRTLREGAPSLRHDDSRWPGIWAHLDLSLDEAKELWGLQQAGPVGDQLVIHPPADPDATFAGPLGNARRFSTDSGDWSHAAVWRRRNGRATTLTAGRIDLTRDPQFHSSSRPKDRLRKLFWGRFRGNEYSWPVSVAAAGSAASAARMELARALHLEGHAQPSLEEQLRRGLRQGVPLDGFDWVGPLGRGRLEH